MRRGVFSIAAVAGLALSVCAAQEQAAPATQPGAALEPAAPATRPAPAALELTEASLEARLQRIEASTDIEESLRKRILEQLREALAKVRNANASAARIGELEHELSEYPRLLDEVRRSLDMPAEASATAMPADATTAQLEQALSAAEAELRVRQEAVRRADEELKRRASVAVEHPPAMTATTHELSAVLEELDAAPPADEPPELAAARRTRALARRAALEQRIVELERELTYYDAAGELLTVRRDVAARAVPAAEKLVDERRAALNERRRAEAEQAASAARSEAAMARPEVRALADENARLATRRAAVARKLEGVSGEAAEVDRRLKQLRDGVARMRELAGAAQASEAVGLLLRNERAELEDLPALRRRNRERRSELSATYFESIQCEDERARLADQLDERVQEALAGLDKSVDADVRPLIEYEVRRLLRARVDYLYELREALGKYARALGALEMCESGLIGESTASLRFIDERILWVRSAPPLALSDGPRAIEALRWLLGPHRLIELAQVVRSGIRSDPLLLGVAAPAALVIALYFRRRMWAQLRRIGATDGQPPADRFAPTAQALALTLLLSAIWPAVVWFVGWRLGAPASSSEAVKAIASSLHTVALSLLGLLIVWNLTQPGGLAEAHFQWSPVGVARLRQAVSWIMALGLPATFVFRALELQSNDAYRDSLGRLAYLAAMTLLAVLLYVFLSPRRGILRSYMAARRGGWVDRLRYVWYPVAVLVAPTCIVLACLGYLYTAMSLGMRLRATLWVILAAVVLHAVLERWLLVVRRRLAIEHARRQRSPAAPADGEQHTKIDATDDEAGSADPSSELRADLATLSDQTRQILRSLVTFGGLVCLWFIWVEMVPALAVLDQIRVWSTVTLADLGLTAVILLLTFIAARNIPGFLEITLLQRLPLDSGQRFATTAIGRYAIIVIGVVAAFNALGVAWNDVQWLVAAMTVGLGFGLQEIFANFVSGLIILFERPVRVGDVITIGNVTGTVTKIQIRATTVMDWDRKELVVPNKEFLTGHVVNWSLPDEKLRLVIKLGVAYGSDTRLVRRILLDVAGRNPRVAKDPPPQVWFNEFGDSALNFELRVVVRGLDDYMLVQHQLHTAIDDAFREAKITIPFPQRQVHVLGERSSAGELQDAKAD